MVGEFPTRRLSISKIASERTLPKVRNRAALTLSAFGTAPSFRSSNEFWRSMAAEKPGSGASLALDLHYLSPCCNTILRRFRNS